jgi:hypothetical protein
VCFTVVVPELVVDPLELPPELDPPDERGVVLRGAVDVGAGANGATTTGAVAAARSAADIESSVAWFRAARARLSAEFWSDLEHANAPRIAVAARKFRILMVRVLIRGVNKV